VRTDKHFPSQTLELLKLEAGLLSTVESTMVRA
jgi:hypothetical protein